MAPELTSEPWTQIRHDYEHTEKPVEDICAEHGISSGTLRDRMRRWRWTRRRQPIPAEGLPPVPAPQIEPAAPFPGGMPQIETAAPPAAPSTEVGAPSPAVPEAVRGEYTAAPPNADPALIVARLQGAVARVLPAIEATLARLGAAHTHPRDMERAARVLAALTRTLRELNALLGQYPVPAAVPDRGPEGDDAFMRDLARRIDLFAAAHPGGAPPQGS